MGIGASGAQRFERIVNEVPAKRQDLMQVPLQTFFASLTAQEINDMSMHAANILMPSEKGSTWKTKSQVESSA